MSCLAASEIEIVRRLTNQLEDGISDAVCELLYRLARDVPEGQTIVEISSGKGKSTVWLAKGSETGHKNVVYTIVSYKGSQAHINEDEENTDKEFIATLARAGVQDTVISLNEASDEATRRWKNKIGLLWINIPHEYEDIKRVIITWQRHLSPNARVAIHGCDQPGIDRFIIESTGSLGDFTFEEIVDTTTVLMIDQCVHYWIIDSDEIGICKHCGRKRNFKRLARQNLETETRRRQAVKRGK